MNDYQFRNNTNKRRYELEIEDGDLAIIDYRTRPDGALVFTHTEVPYQHENKGIGGQIVKKSLDEVRECGLKIIPQCGFVASYIRRHPEYADLVTERD